MIFGPDRAFVVSKSNRARVWRFASESDGSSWYAFGRGTRSSTVAAIEERVELCKMSFRLRLRLRFLGLWVRERLEAPMAFFRVRKGLLPRRLARTIAIASW